MIGKPGDRMIVESEHVGTPKREGEILEVIEGSVGVSYRVLWTDGHQSVFTPALGSARIEAASGRRAAAPRRSPAQRTGARKGSPSSGKARTRGS